MELEVLGDDAPAALDRALEPEHLLDRRWPQRGRPANRLERLGLAREDQDAVGDQVAGRVVAGDHQLRREHRRVVALELARVRRPCQERQQVVRRAAFVAHRAAPANRSESDVRPSAARLASAASAEPVASRSMSAVVHSSNPSRSSSATPSSSQTTSTGSGSARSRTTSRRPAASARSSRAADDRLDPRAQSIDDRRRERVAQEPAQPRVDRRIDVEGAAPEPRDRLEKRGLVGRQHLEQGVEPAGAREARGIPEHRCDVVVPSEDPDAPGLAPVERMLVAEDAVGRVRVVDEPGGGQDLVEWRGPKRHDPGAAETDLVMLTHPTDTPSGSVIDVSSPVSNP